MMGAKGKDTPAIKFKDYKNIVDWETVYIFISAGCALGQIE